MFTSSPNKVNTLKAEMLSILFRWFEVKVRARGRDIRENARANKGKARDNIGRAGIIGRKGKE